eukprot:16595_1
MISGHSHNHPNNTSTIDLKKPKSQPPLHLVSSIKNIPNTSIKSHKTREATVDLADIHSLRLSVTEFAQIHENVNDALTKQIPTANSTLYVCNNATFKHLTKSEFIVIKQVNKKKLKVGELAECRVDVKVHAHLMQHDLSVIKLLGWFEDEHRFAAVFEYASNGDLLEELNHLTNPFDPVWFNKALDELRNISQTLAYMHHEGWSHKDLTLENILVDKNRNFYLHDFALIEEFTECELNVKEQSEQPCDQRITRHSSLWSGKIEHMSPENYDTYIGNINLFDAFSNDIWGLGVILMCCFSTQAFLWNAPDKKTNAYIQTMNNITSKLEDVFKIEEQTNAIIKKKLIALIDLLTSIFVDEQNRIDIDEVLRHEFFENAIVEPNHNDPVLLLKKEEVCCENCILL